MTKKKDDGSHPSTRWYGDKGMIRKNFDLGEGPYNGTPGGGEKSMGDFIKKRRKNTKKVLKEHGQVIADYVSDISKLATEFYNRVINGKENS